MPKYEVVLLDADETLFDFRKAEGWALREAFRQRGRALTDGAAAAYDEINAGLWRRLERGELDQRTIRSERFRLLFERLGMDEDPLAFGELYVERLSTAAFLLDGAEELCERLSATRRLAIVTNGIADVQKSRLARSPIARFIEKAIVSEEVGAAKPDPAIFAKALELLGVSDKSRVVMVGDSLASDIKGGIAFGIDTCWVNLRGSAPDPAIAPTYTARSLAEIERFV
jgi:2-haloacid dehalogenase